MEESITNPWLQDWGGLLRINLGDEVYFSAGQDQSESSSLQPSVASHIEVTNSSSSTLSSETAEPYAYFDPYMETVACKGLQAQDPSRDRREESLSDVLEQILTCKDTESQSQSAWGIHQPVDLATSGEPLHQLPGWTEHNYMMEDWQPSSICTPQLESPFSTATDSQLNHEPWMMEMPSLYPTNTLEMSPISQLFHSGNMVTSFEDHVEQSQHPRSPSHTPNELVAANRKAGARRKRILLRQQSAPHQRGTSHAVQAANGSGSPRALKKMYSNKIPQELLMHAHVQGRNMDPLRFILHKVLQPSDVSNLGRIIISKKEAEAHLPYLALKEGIFITMEDFDTAELWTFRYRFWPNIKSRMYLLESTGEFIRAHHLKKGDIVILWRNSLRGTFVIQAMMALPTNERASSAQNTDYGVAKVRVEAREDDIKGKTKASGEVEVQGTESWEES